MGWLNINGNWIGRNRGSGSLSSYWTNRHPELKTYIDGLVTPLSEARIVLLGTVIEKLKLALGISSLSDAFIFFYFLANEGDEVWKRNIVKDAHHVTQHGGTYTEDSGWQGNGIDAYLDTNCNLSTDGGTIYTLNNASLGIYSLTDATETTCDIGSRTSTNDYSAILSKIVGRESSSRLHNGTVPVIASTPLTSAGQFVIERDGPNAVDISGFYNLVESLSIGDSGVTTNIPNCNTYIGARSYSNTPELFSSRKYAYAWAGKHFTSTEIAAIYNIMVGDWI